MTSLENRISEVNCSLRTCSAIAAITNTPKVSICDLYIKTKERCPDLEIKDVLRAVVDSTYEVIQEENQLFIKF